MSLWNARDAQAATQGTLSGATDWIAHGIAIDSRAVQPGDLFVALQGPNHDAHAFVTQAIQAGAVAALVHAIPAGAEHLPLLLVPDSLKGLEDLARAARARSQARIIAVTGSVGKTGTKEMLALALSEQGPTHYSVGSFNNHWGVPLSLARMPQDCQYGIFELGMNHPGEITPLAAMVRPHVAIITTIEAVHLAHFPDTAAIAQAKAEIFSGLEPGGIAILNRDNRHYHQLKDAASQAGILDIRSFGSHIQSRARLLDHAVDPADTSVFALFGDRAVAYRVNVSGKQWAMNSLAVLLGVEALGADLPLAAKSLARLSPPKGRGQRHKVAWAGGSIEVIDESYNASPISMKAALAALAAARPGRDGARIAILGDMLELGEESVALHAGLAPDVTAWGITKVHVAGPLMRHLWTALKPEQRGVTAGSSSELVEKIKDHIAPGDVVMVKGSAGSRMSLVVNALLEGC